MAKRKRSRMNKSTNAANQHRRIWPEEVTEELIAFLDYGVHKKMGPADINEEAAQHLTTTCGDGDYSSAQVKTKLRWLWMQFGPNDDLSGNPDRIYEEGSKNLSWLEEGQRERIADRFKAISDQKLIEFYTSPRQTRSGSQALNRSTASPGRFRSGSPSSTVTFNSSKISHTSKVHPLRQHHSNLVSGHAETLGPSSYSTAKLMAE